MLSIFRPVVSGIFMFFLPGSLYLQAQKQPLPLTDAVLKAATELAPGDLPDLRWIPGSAAFSYRSFDGTALLRAEVHRVTPDTLLQLAQLQEALNAPGLTRLPALTWISQQSLMFAHNRRYYTYNLTEGAVQRIFDLPEKGANADLHPATLSLAYTLGSDLRVTDTPTGDRAVTSGADPAVVSGQAIARVEFGITKGTFWSPDGKYLAFYQKDERGVSDYPLLDLSGTPAGSKWVKYPMAGQVSELPAVGIYDRASGSRVYLDGPDEKDSYRTNLAWDPSGRIVYLAELNRAQNHLQLNSYDALSGKKLSTLFEERHDKWVEPETAPWFVPDRPGEFVWLSERDGFMNLYLYHTSGRLIRQLTANTWVAQEILGMDYSGQGLIFSGTGADARDLHLFRVDLRTGRQTQLTGDPGRHSGLLSDDGRYLLVRSSGVTVPMVIRLLDLKSGKLVRTVFESPNPLAGYAVGSILFPVLEAADGTPLHGRLILPSNFDPSRKYPVLVYVYGGPHLQLVTNGWLGGTPLWMLSQVEKGCLLFTLDNRGSANRGFAFESVIHRRLGDAEITDQLRGLQYLRSLPYVDSDRMAVYGWSYGGFMAAGLMLKTPGHFRAGVAGGPVTDWKFYEVMYGERYMDRPEENPEGYAATSLLNHAGALEGDLLLVHGAMDSTVVPQHVFELVNRFIAAGKQFDFFLYPGHPHNVSGRDRLHLMQKILGYIDEKLKIAPDNDNM
jgi:dipeptidyl-peptidase 4